MNQVVTDLHYILHNVIVTNTAPYAQLMILNLDVSKMMSNYAREKKQQNEKPYNCFVTFTCIHSYDDRPGSESESERQRARNGMSEIFSESERQYIRASRSERNLERHDFFRFVMLQCFLYHSLPFPSPLSLSFPPPLRSRTP